MQIVIYKQVNIAPIVAPDVALPCLVLRGVVVGAAVAVGERGPGAGGRVPPARPPPRLRSRHLGLGSHRRKKVSPN